MSRCCLSLFESYLNHLDSLGQKMRILFQMACSLKPLYTGGDACYSAGFFKLYSSELFLTFDHWLAVLPVTVKLNMLSFNDCKALMQRLL